MNAALGRPPAQLVKLGELLVVHPDLDLVFAPTHGDLPIFVGARSLPLGGVWETRTVISSSPLARDTARAAPDGWGAAP